MTLFVVLLFITVFGAFYLVVDVSIIVFQDLNTCNLGAYYAVRYETTAYIKEYILRT